MAEKLIAFAALLFLVLPLLAGIARLRRIRRGRQEDDRN
jgi:hypothetical protein